MKPIYRASLLIAAILLSACSGGGSDTDDLDLIQNDSSLEQTDNSKDGSAEDGTNSSTGSTVLTTPGICGAPGSWDLASQHSQLSFVTTKQTDVVEAHQFQQVSGGIDASLQARLSINLASVTTGIEIRDQRLRDLLFEVGSFSTATVSIALDNRDVEQLSNEPSVVLEKQVSVDLHGISTLLDAKLLASCLNQEILLVKTQQPVLLDARLHGLEPGLEILRQLAGLDTINPIVPVDLVLVFKRS